jgi:hypothetical protein
VRHFNDTYRRAVARCGRGATRPFPSRRKAICWPASGISS